MMALVQHLDHLPQSSSDSTFTLPEHDDRRDSLSDNFFFDMFATSDQLATTATTTLMTDADGTDRYPFSTGGLFDLDDEYTAMSSSSLPAADLDIANMFSSWGEEDTSSLLRPGNNTVVSSTPLRRGHDPTLSQAFPGRDSTGLKSDDLGRAGSSPFRVPFSSSSSTTFSPSPPRTPSSRAIRIKGRGEQQHTRPRSGERSYRWKNVNEGFKANKAKKKKEKDNHNPSSETNDSKPIRSDVDPSHSSVVGSGMDWSNHHNLPLSTPPSGRAATDDFTVSGRRRPGLDQLAAYRTPAQQTGFESSSAAPAALALDFTMFRRGTYHPESRFDQDAFLDDDDSIHPTRWSIPGGMNHHSHLPTSGDYDQPPPPPPPLDDEVPGNMSSHDLTIAQQGCTWWEGDRPFGQYQYPSEHTRALPIWQGMVSEEMNDGRLCMNGLIISGVGGSGGTGTGYDYPQGQGHISTTLLSSSPPLIPSLSFPPLSSPCPCGNGGGGGGGGFNRMTNVINNLKEEKEEMMYHRYSRSPSPLTIPDLKVNSRSKRESKQTKVTSSRKGEKDDGSSNTKSIPPPPSSSSSSSSLPLQSPSSSTTAALSVSAAAAAAAVAMSVGGKGDIKKRKYQRKKPRSMMMIDGHHHLKANQKSSSSSFSPLPCSSSSFPFRGSCCQSTSSKPNDDDDHHHHHQQQQQQQQQQEESVSNKPCSSSSSSSSSSLTTTSLFSTSNQPKHNHHHHHRNNNHHHHRRLHHDHQNHDHHHNNDDNHHHHHQEEEGGERDEEIISFVNFTPLDKSTLLNGVAPSGSSKTKARRDQEAAERRRSLNMAAIRAVRAVGGDVALLGIDPDL